MIQAYKNVSHAHSHISHAYNIQGKKQKTKCQTLRYINFKVLKEPMLIINLLTFPTFPLHNMTKAWNRYYNTHLENQVSRTSGSWYISTDFPYFSRALASASSELLATMYSSSQSLPTMYQTGIWCPHHNCLLIHQSLIFVNQCLYI